MSGGPPPVTLLNEGGASACVLLCEHASNFIPAAYRDLGLPPEELSRHIAWDIGAAGVAGRLSSLLDAPLFLSHHSRLLIDLNRPFHAPSSIPEVSEATPIPGNRGLEAAERARRQATYFTPFHDRVSAFLDRRQAAGVPTAVVGMHSFTPVYLGERRRWHTGVLFGRAERFARALVSQLSVDPALVVGANEPYEVTDDTDYTVPVHGDRRGLPAVLLEVRQDLLATEEGQRDWATRLAAALEACLPPG
jgi:predicted N-formylglutamate amidohydrolase